MAMPCEVQINLISWLEYLGVLAMVQLSFEQEQILIGAILGDACVEKNGDNCRVKFDHSLVQEQYLSWKYNKLANVSTKIRHSVVLDPRTQKQYSHVLFNTKSHRVFNRYEDLFYSSHLGARRKKLVPENIVDLLKSPTALAVWYLDDGAKRSDCNALRIHTNSYPKDNQELLIEALHVNYGIRAKLHKVKNEEYVIYIPSRIALEFCEIISPIVNEISSMRYKLLNRVTTEERVAQAALVRDGQV